MVLPRLPQSQIALAPHIAQVILRQVCMVFGGFLVMLMCAGCSLLPAQLGGDRLAVVSKPRTFTPVPQAQNAVVLAGSLVANHAATLTAVPTVTSTPTVTPTSTPTATSTPYPTPYALVGANAVQGRRGPDPSFELLGQAVAEQELTVLGRTPDNSWLQICCIANQAAWVQAGRVNIQGVLDAVQPIAPPPTPTPVPTATSPNTPTPSSTPMPPFDIARGPEFPWKVSDGVLTIRVKVFEGPRDNEKPVGGYVLRVLRDGSDVSHLDQPSHDAATGFDSTGANLGGYLYNLKYEMLNAGEADWTIWLARPDGSIVSPKTTFTTRGAASQNSVVFIAYRLAR